MEDFSEDVRPNDFTEIAAEKFYDTERLAEPQQEYGGRLPNEHNHLVAGIVITALFSVFGLPTLINACKSLIRWRHGNYELALQAARKAKRWKFWGIFLGIIFVLAYVALLIWLDTGGFNDFDFDNYANPDFNY